MDRNVFMIGFETCVDVLIFFVVSRSLVVFSHYCEVFFICGWFCVIVFVVLLDVYNEISTLSLPRENNV